MAGRETEKPEQSGGAKANERQEETVIGCIIRRGKTSFRLKFDLGKDPATGKRQLRFVTIRGNRRDAERELARLLNEVNNNLFVDPDKVTMAEFLDRWVRDYAATHVAATTLQRYRSVIEHHLKPAFGAMLVQKLLPIHIQAYYAKELQDGARKDHRKGGLSPRTVHHHHRILSEVMKTAVRWQLLQRNPCSVVDPPRIQPTEVEVLDEGDSAVLIETSKGTRLYIPILLAIGAGLRRGEILALRWEDLDDERGTLRIARALEQTKESGVRIKPPKNNHTRTVALPPMVHEALGELRREQESVMEMLGEGYTNDGFICCQPHGEIWAPAAFTSAYRALLSRRGLPGPNFHALRHSHASHLLRAGVDLKEISARLGHSRASFTLSTYVHLMPGQDHEAARRTDEMLRKAIENQRKLAVLPKPAKAS